MIEGPPWSISDCSVYLKYVCPESGCVFSTPTEADFCFHMTKNHEILTISQPKNSSFTVNCQSCGFEFYSIIELKKHINDEHSESLQNCQKIQENHENHQIVTKLRCQICQSDFRSYHYLKNHHDNKHQNQEINFTKRTLQVFDQEEEKLIKEVNGKIFKCDYCDYVTSHSDLRGLHMQKEHKDLSKIIWFRCQFCDFKCKTRKSILNHKHKHKDGTLEEAKFQYKIIENSPETCEKVEDMKIISTKVVLQCQKCENHKEFNYFHALKAHFESVHNGSKIDFKKRVIQGNDGLQDLFQNEDGNCELYSCDHCDYTTHMKDLCGIHMEKEHKDPSKLVYVQCDKCSYSSKSRGNLINHKRLVHENYKPKKCGNCGKRFSTKSLLEEHIQRFHSPEGILCNDCGKIFASQKLLKRHELWHHSPEAAGGPTPCHICGKISIHKFALHKHILRVHRKEDSLKQNCDICGKSYCDRKTLKMHMSKVHQI